MPGAKISVPALNIVVSSNRSGDFRISGMPAGSYEIKATTIGFDEINQKVTVDATGTTTVAFEMGTGSEVVRLDPFRVSGLREARLMALQQKRSSQNTMDIITADAVGKLPDINVAEAISRLPGVFLSRDETSGEGQFVSIRGVAPNLNQTTLNGATVANPGAGFDGLDRAGRAMPLSVIGSAQIAQVEVIKVPTSDMDGSGLGGTVNIITPSAYDRSHPFLFGTIEYAKNSLGEWADTENYSGDITYGSTFGADKRWGVMVAANASRRPFRNDQLQGVGLGGRVGGVPVPTGLEVHPIWGTHDNLGLTTNLEFRPDAGNRYYFRYNFNELTEKQNREEERNYADGTPSYDPVSKIGKYSLSQSELRAFRSKTTKSLNNASLGGEINRGDLTFTPEFTYSGALETLDYDNALQFRQPGGSSGAFGFVLDQYHYTVFSEPSYFNYATYALRRSIQADGEVKEDTYTPKLDVKWNSVNLFGHPGYIKVGGKYTDRSRQVTQSSFRLNGNLSLANIGVLPGKRVFDGRYIQPFSYKWDETWAAIYSAKAAGILSYDVEDSMSNGAEDAYSLTESIASGYALGFVKIGDLSVSTGVRYEYTKSNVKAFQANYQNGNFLGLSVAKGSTDYGHILPNVQFKYDFSPQLVGRASVTRTLGRPDFHAAAPISSFKYENQGLDPNFPNVGSLSIGNPDLKPYSATNYDLSLDYYMKNVGLLSVALFQKNVSDPIYPYSEILLKTDHDGVKLNSLGISSTRNANSGTIRGVEVTVNLPLTFLPSPMNGLGIEANAAFISSSVNVTGRTADVQFFQQPDKVANFALYYQKDRFAVRFAYQYFGASLQSLAGSPSGDVYHMAHSQYDMQISYRINDKASLYVSGQNLGEELDEYYYGVNNDNGFAKVNMYPRVIHAGIRFTY